MMLEDQINRNTHKSYALLIIVPVLLVVLLYATGRVFVPRASPFLILSVGIAVSLGYTLYSYYRSDKLVLSSVDATRADETRFKQYHDLVEGLCLASGLPKPELYVQESQDINAFAAGRDPDNAVICVTTGALGTLEKDELEGVLAHELAHIENRDVLFMTLVVALIGAISILSELFLHGMWFGGGRDNRNGPLLAIGIVLAILAPITARLVQFAVSRQREFLADASGAKMTRYPDGLANALEKISQQNQGMDVNSAVSSLYFAQPLKGKITSLTATHPPTDERVQRLRDM